jgi:hypothetical protein
MGVQLTWKSETTRAGRGHESIGREYTVCDVMRVDYRERVSIYRMRRHDPHSKLNKECDAARAGYGGTGGRWELKGVVGI